MNKIKAAIIEDEVPAARLLHEMIPVSYTHLTLPTTERV